MKMKISPAEPRRFPPKNECTREEALGLLLFGGSLLLGCLLLFRSGLLLRGLLFCHENSPSFLFIRPD